MRPLIETAFRGLNFDRADSRTRVRIVRVAVLTFGCRVNQAESQAIERELCALGAEMVGTADAELVLVNSCSVTATADQVGTTRPALTIEDGTTAVTDNGLRRRIPPGRQRNEWVRVEVTDASCVTGCGF